MHIIYLKDEDMIKEADFPIIALLNEAANDDILMFIENMNNNVGSGYDYASSYFWDELDEYDKEHISKYDGVLIETEDGESLNATYQEMYAYLKMLVDRLTDDYKDKTLELLQSFAEKHNIDQNIII